LSIIDKHSYKAQKKEEKEKVSLHNS
jgi:hypothetical protein